MSVTSNDRPCQHPGPHLVTWNSRTNGSPTRLAQNIETALNHVFPDDLDDPRDIEVVQQLVDRAHNANEQIRPGAVDARSYCIEVTDAELVAVKHVLDEACEYMITNDYAADGDFPEDAAAAQVLGSGAVARLCWSPRV